MVCFNCTYRIGKEFDVNLLRNVHHQCSAGAVQTDRIDAQKTFVVSRGVVARSYALDYKIGHLAHTAQHLQKCSDYQ